MTEETVRQPEEEETGPVESPEEFRPAEGSLYRWAGVAVSAVRQAAGWLRRAWATGPGEDISPWQDIRSAFGGLEPRRVAVALAGLATAGYLLSGVYVVNPGEAAVVRRFGAVVAPRVGEGLHYRLPWPVEQMDVVNVSQVRRESIGLEVPEPEHPAHPEPPGRWQALTGDTNIIDVQLVVQYQVKDPAAYLFNVDYAPYRLVRDAVRQAVTDLIGGMPVDEVLTTERQRLEARLREQAQQRLDEYGSGLAVVSINIQKAYPPDEVADAFRDVASAKEDKAKATNEAQGYANSVIPEARGEAQKTLSQAEAYRTQVVDQATGEARAFESMLAEYRKNSLVYGEAVTRYRLYLETMEKVLPRVDMYVVDAGDGGKVNLRLFNGKRVRGSSR